MLRFICCVKNVAAGHTKINISNRETDYTGADFLYIGITMKITTFGSYVAQCFWFWDVIQLLHESNVKHNFNRIQGLVSDMCALKKFSSGFNYSTHTNIIFSTSTFDSVVFNSAIRDDIMKFSFQIDQCQSCGILKFAGRM